MVVPLHSQRKLSDEELKTKWEDGTTTSGVCNTTLLKAKTCCSVTSYGKLTAWAAVVSMGILGTKEEKGING